MSRWLDMAKETDEISTSYPGTQQEPSKRLKGHKNKEAQPTRASQQKPAERVHVDCDPDFLMVSAGAAPSDETPTNKGRNGFLLVSDGCRDRELEKKIPSEAGVLPVCSLDHISETDLLPTEGPRPAKLIQGILREATSEHRVDDILNANDRVINAIAALGDPLWAAESTHITNLAKLRKNELVAERARRRC